MYWELSVLQFHMYWELSVLQFVFVVILRKLGITTNSTDSTNTT